MVAISVDKPEKSRELAGTLKIPFLLLSDADHKVIDAYDIYNAQGRISQPATFVLDEKGIVRWSFFKEDYKERPFVQVILDELKRIT